MGEAFEPGDPRRNATLLYFRRSTDEPSHRRIPTSLMASHPYPPPWVPTSTRRPTRTDTAPQVQPYGFLGKHPPHPLSGRAADAAEAANEKGLTGEAAGYLEQVRAHARGTLADVLPKVESASQSVLRDAIRHERRVELALEPDRFYDLVRWGIAKEVLQAAGKNYQDKNALLPLPQTEIDKSNGVLVQNPDY